MKLKRCPNMHYYDEDKYAVCPHCAAAKKKAEAAVPKADPEPSQAEFAEPNPGPEVNFEQKEGDEAVSAPLPAENKEEPAKTPGNTEEPEVRSLTEAINEVSFTGSIGEAKKMAAGNDDDGVTRIIFDELADNLVLGWLVAVNTEIKGKVFTITETRTTIGRSDLEHPVDIDLHQDRAVSRGIQAVLAYDPLNKKFFINAAGGKTPVYANRQMVMVPVELSAGDIIMLGETSLVFAPLCCDKFSW